MWARFTVLNETPIAAAIAGCVIPLSRSNTIWMRSRCAAGIFQRSAVFSCRICRLVHLTIRSPESDGHSESYCEIEGEAEMTANPSIQSAMEPVLYTPTSIVIHQLGDIGQFASRTTNTPSQRDHAHVEHCAALLRRSGQRRVLADAGVGEPLFPDRGVVRPLLHFDAPRRRLGGQEECVALGGGQAARDSHLGTRYKFFRVGINFPQPRRLVRRRSDDALAVRAEGDAHHPILMAFERLTDGLAGFGVPQSRRLVSRRGDNAPAVGAEHRALHASIMAFERLTDRPAGLAVPQPRRLIPRRGDDAFAIGTERRAQHATIMAVERLTDWPAGFAVPLPRRLVLRRCDDTPPIRTKRRAPYHALVA